jgi:N-acetylglutamate synthase-like GNAT family acetyltransferase
VTANLNAITLRAELPEDEPLVFELYSSTRQAELDAMGWSNEMRASFLTMQFKAQQRGYRSEFSQAAFQIILVNNQAVGRMVIHRTSDAIQLVDLVILPERCNGGIGTALITGLIKEAAAAQKPLRLTVLQGNRATRLYQRLGFTKMGESGLYVEMEWRAKEHPAG